jgi:hypothetical protein
LQLFFFFWKASHFSERMLGTFLFCTSMALSHLVKLDCKQWGKEFVSVPPWILQQALLCWLLLCSEAQAPACVVHNSRKKVLLKDRKDQKREHKNTRYLYIWVSSKVREWGKKKQIASKNICGIWMLYFLGWQRGNFEPVCLSHRIHF